MNELFEERKRLQRDFLEFTRIYYKHRTGRHFDLSYPIGRESHYLSICRELIKVAKGETKRLIINVPPRYGKTELVIHFVAWTLSIWPDSNYLYISYSHSLAKKQTQTIRSIITLSNYKTIMGVELKDDQSAKDNFETKQGGSIYAAGAGGTITGRGAGIKSCDRFGGCIIIDDIHKPDEVTSDTIREGVKEWYYNTLQSRLNSPNTPIIFIGQRLHEDDLAANLLNTQEWKSLILPAIDEAGNALHHEMHDIKLLKQMQKEMPYEFAAQYQQDPQPAGGGIFKTEWFVTHEFEPEIFATFITIDTAETDKDYNDATAFSFWGVYKIKHGEIETDMYGLHWIDCMEVRIEPKDLETTFLEFFYQSRMHKVKPDMAALEKKSTGITLASVIEKYQGMKIINIERTKVSGSKTKRFLEMQPYAARKQISLPLYGKHTKICIEHMRKITANNSHRFDDIADTAYDAVKIALIDNLLLNKTIHRPDYDKMGKELQGFAQKVDRLRRKAYVK